MKKLFYLIIFSIIFASCKENEEIFPSAFHEKEIFTKEDFKNEESALKALNTVYYALDDVVFMNPYFQVVADVPSLGSADNMKEQWSIDFEQYSWNAHNKALYYIWKSLYKGINRSNAVIKWVPTIPLTRIEEDLQNRIVLEAKFLRAYYYFTLLKLFGNVPLLDIDANDPNVYDLNIRQNVWGQVINDLTDAVSLPIQQGIADHLYRATSGAANALLGAVYLQRSGLGIANEYDLALNHLNKVINSGRYILLKDYERVFDETNTENFEMIFSIYPKEPNETDSTLNVVEPWIPSIQFYNMFERKDQRMKTIFNKFSIKDINDNTFKKFQGSVPRYLCVLRLADVWLMHSEALNEIESQDHARLTGINLVRTRAGLDPVDNSLSKEAFRKLILLEREKEFCLEQKAVFDYRRFGSSMINWIMSYGSHHQFQVEKKHLLYPFPQEILDTKLTSWQQNNGY